MWQTTLTLMLRHYIDDVDETTYTSERLQEVLIVAALHVYSEVTIRNSYDISLNELDITPDPTYGDYRDDNFCMLIAYKAAAIITASEFKTSAGKNILVRDGGSEVDMRSLAAQKKAAAEFYKNGYDDMKFRYSMNNTVPFAIISPPTIVSGSYSLGFYGLYGNLGRF